MHTCKICLSQYHQNDVFKNFGTNHKGWCWPCLKKWIDDAANDPYAVGAGYMRGESPHNVEPELVERFKTAFELALSKLQETKS